MLIMTNHQSQTTTVICPTYYFKSRFSKEMSQIEIYYLPLNSMLDNIVYNCYLRYTLCFI